MSQKAVVVVAKRKRKKSAGSQWSFRLAGIVLCAFFTLGMVAGLSRSGRRLALRIEALLDLWPYHGRSTIIQTIFSDGAVIEPIARRHPAGSAVALVQRSDGFYALDSAGDLHGPVSPVSQGDLPILSGAAVERASPKALLEYATVMVRAEAGLGDTISEMRAGDDGTATLFIDHPHLEMYVDLDRAGLDLARATRVLSMWHGHEQLIASIDMTTAGQAVVRLKPAALEAARRAPAMRKLAYASAEPVSAAAVRAAHGDSEGSAR